MPPSASHCLVIAGVFPPGGGGGALRLVKLLKHLPRYGWQPHVIAPRGRSGWFSDPDLLAEVAGIEVTRVGLPTRQRIFEGWRRHAKDPGRPSSGDGLLSTTLRLGAGARDLLAVPDEHLPWAAVAGWQAWRRLQRGGYDLLVTTSYPYSCHLAGLLLRRAGATPWLADFADPWAGRPVRRRDRGLGARLDLALEERVLRAADGVSVVSPGMKKMLASRWPWAEPKIELLANAYDEEEFCGPVAVREDGLFEVLFVGTFDHRVSPPQPFVEALARLAAQQPGLSLRLRFRVAGGADLETSRYIRDRLQAIGAPGLVRFEGYTTHARAVRAMRAADALFISVAPGAYWHLTAKVFEYLASGTPILAAVPPGDCRDLLARCGGAALFDPSDHDGIAAALAAALRRGTLGVDQPRDENAVRELAAPEVARKAAEVMTRLAQTRSSEGQRLNHPPGDLV